MKRTIKQTVCTAVISALALTGVLGDAAASQAAAGARKIVLNKKKVTVTVGKTFRLKVKRVTPAKAGKAVIYKSNNKKTASVSRKGVIKGIKVGTAKITVTSKKNKKIKATVKVTVKRAAASPGSTPPVNKVSETNVPATATPSAPTSTQSAYASQAPAATGTPGNTASPTGTPPVGNVPETNAPVTATPSASAETSILKYDFTDETLWKNESPDKASTRINPDGSITIKFTEQYGAVNFVLPDQAQNDSIDYKSLVFQYAVKGGEVGYVPYGSGADNPGGGGRENGTGEYPICTWPLQDSGKWILTHYAYATDEHIGGGFRGIQFFCQGEASEEKPVFVMVRNLTFYSQEDIIFIDDPEPLDIEFDDVNVPATPPPVTTPPAFASFQYDFTDEASWKNESPDQTSTRINTDGSITIKFTKQYGAVNFALPDKAQSDSIEYKTYEFQYAVKGGEVGYVLYGSEAADGTGEHPVCTWPLKEIDRWLLTRYGFAKSEHINGGFQGIRFFCQGEASQEKPVYVIIKGLDFCNRDDLMFTGDPVEREIDFEDVDTGSVEKPVE